MLRTVFYQEELIGGDRIYSDQLPAFPLKAQPSDKCRNKPRQEPEELLAKVYVEFPMDDIIGTSKTVRSLTLKESSKRLTARNVAGSQNAGVRLYESAS